MVNSASQEMEAPVGGNADADFRADETQQERCVCSGLLTSGCSTLSTCSFRMGNGSVVWRVVKNVWLVH